MNVLSLSDAQLNRLKETELKTYSPTGRARGYEFRVAAIDAVGITVCKQNGKEQRASWREVSFIKGNWLAFKAGEVSRKELSKKSFSTSYLFAIFHFIDNCPN